MLITAQDKRIHQQRQRVVYADVEILTSDLLPIRNIEGRVLSGDIKIDAGSSVRRTCSLTITVPHTFLDIETSHNYWIDKFFRLSIGILDLQTNNIQWYKQGIFVIDAPTLKYSATTSEVSITGMDQMVKLTGDRGGKVDEIPTLFPKGLRIEEAFIQILENFTPFHSFQIEDGGYRIPFDLKFDYNSTIYDMFVRLRDLYPGYEMFFDVDGKFIFQKIPTGKDELSILDSEFLKDFVVSEDMSVSYSDIRNRIFIYGKNLEPNVYTEVVSTAKYISTNNYDLDSTTPDTYVISLSDFEESYLQIEGYIVGFTPPDVLNIITSPKIAIRINDTTILGPYDLVNMYKEPVVLKRPKSFYCFQFAPDTLGGDNFLYLGNQQITAEAKDTNEMSPYRINGPAGLLQENMSGGDFDNIYSDELAQDRAEYELWKATRLNDGITLQLTPLYFLNNINKKITYRHENYDELEYLIKSVSIGLGPEGVQSVQAIRYYPLYPQIVDNINKSVIKNTINVRDYIQSAGTQYIKSSFYPTNNTSLELEYTLTATTGWLFGSMGGVLGNSNDMFGMFCGDSVCEVYLGSQKKTLPAEYSTLNVRRKIILNKEGLFFDGEAMPTVSFEPEVFLGARALAFFSCVVKDEMSPEHMTGKIHSLKIKEGVIDRYNLVPALDEKGTYCLYNKIEAKYLRNASGVGEFSGS